MSRTAARFNRVEAELLPECLKVAGVAYDPGNVHADWLRVAYNAAAAHLGMASRLLELTAGMEPEDYKLLARGAIAVPNEVADLVHEIKCQNGSNFITALFKQLTKANGSRR